MNQTALRCRVYDTNDNLIEEYRYFTSILDRETQIKHAQFDILLKHGCICTFTLIEDKKLVPHRVSDFFMHQHQTIS